MDYQYRYSYINKWDSPAIRPRYRSICEERCREELKRLEQGFYREMDNLQRYYYQPDDYYRRAEHDTTSYYYTQRDRITEYWRREQQYEEYANRDYRNTFDNVVGYNLIYTLSTPTPLLLENKTMPTETKKFIIISSAGAAEHPTEHKTLAEAETEAQRLARQFPKQEFTVYETKKSYKIADKPVDVKVFI